MTSTDGLVFLNEAHFEVSHGREGALRTYHLAIMRRRKPLEPSYEAYDAVVSEPVETLIFNAAGEATRKTHVLGPLDEWIDAMDEGIRQIARLEARLDAPES